MEFPNRKPNRLKGYDYSKNGTYFITICADRKRPVFSKIVGQGLAPAEIKLSKYGETAKYQLLLLERRYDGLKIDNYVIMPNHIHIILNLQSQSAGASPCPTVSDIMCAYKSITTLKCKKAGYKFNKLFQTSFYDHIIRDEYDYFTKWQYIDENPSKWLEDELYSSVTD